MAFLNRHNITAASGTTAGPINLISSGENAGRLKSILLTNVHASNSVAVNLFIYNSTSATTTHIIKNVSIPSSVSLELDLSEISINTSKNNDSLVIKITQTDIANGGVDVIINK
jgi:hypothetical protein